MKKFIIMAMGCLFIIVSCSSDDQATPLDNGTAPDPVSNVSVEPLPGGAKISYDLPNNENLRYVKAEYYIREGYARESKASLYKNSLVVDGFPNNSSYEVKLYAMSKGEKASEPVSVTVNPLRPPLIEAYETMKFSPTFGGISISFKNEGKAPLAVNLLSKDAEGEFSEVDTYYTESSEGSFSLRGFDAEPHVFAAVVRDRWGNLSDTISAELTPIFEQQIPKIGFQEYHLPSDTYEKHIANGDMGQIWDERIAPNGGIGVFHTKPGSGMPQWFTFDMGLTAKFSRYKLWHRGPGQSWAYQLASPKKWEIWGTAEKPDPSGSWEGWTKLGTFDSYKPSGDGPVTNEDAAYATAKGEDFEFPEDAPPVRYVRFKILETWGFLDYFYLQEVTFWGEISD